MVMREVFSVFDHLSCQDKCLFRSVRSWMKLGVIREVLYRKSPKHGSGIILVIHKLDEQILVL